MESPEVDKETTKVQTTDSSGNAKRRHASNELVFAFLALTVVGILLVIPRPTYPQIVPLPRIDSDRLEHREQLEIKRALRVRDGSLDKETRAIGEQVRRLGATMSSGRLIEPKTLRALRLDIDALTQRKEEDDQLSGIESLLHLRALQGQMFLQAVRDWEKTKKESPELKELGGPFLQIASPAWLDDEGKLFLTRDELRLLFRIHWGKLTGLHGHRDFGPSLEEKRRYYSTNIRHPANPAGDIQGRARTQLGFAQALSKTDPSYPGELAQGILLLRQGDHLAAIHHLKTHLRQHPDGPWAQLAKNHLISATRSANSPEPFSH